MPIATHRHTFFNLTAQWRIPIPGTVTKRKPATRGTKLFPNDALIASIINDAHTAKATYNGVGRPIEMHRPMPGNENITNGEFIIAEVDKHGILPYLVAPRCGVSFQAIYRWMRIGGEIDLRMSDAADTDEPITLHSLSNNDKSYWLFYSAINAALAKHAVQVHSEYMRSVKHGILKHELVEREIPIEVYNSDGTVKGIKKVRIVEREATTTIRDGKAALQWLGTRYKQEYGQKRQMEITGENGKPLQLQSSNTPSLQQIDMKQLTLEQIEVLRQGLDVLDDVKLLEAERDKRSKQKAV